MTMMIYVYKILLFYTCNILNFLLLYGNVKISRFKSAYFDIGGWVIVQNSFLCV